MTTRIIKHLATADVQLLPGERPALFWITTDTPDHELDVVVPGGVDYRSLYWDPARPNGCNPVVMALHDLGKWPVAKTEYIGQRSGDGFTGLVAKFVFDDDPDAEIVWKKVRGRSLRATSIGFKAPPGMHPSEWGAPTREELRRNPHWAGARRVIRRCLLFEVSVVGVPMNANCLAIAVSKGLVRPSALPPLPPVTLPPLPAVKALPPLPPVVPKRGDYVAFTKGRSGVGRVLSVHTGGPVPDVAEDLIATPESPAARVQLWKRYGDGHRKMAFFVGHSCKHMRVIGPLKEATVVKAVEPPPDDNDLPPLPPALPPLPKPPLPPLPPALKAAAPPITREQIRAALAEACADVTAQGSLLDSVLTRAAFGRF